MGSRGGTFSVRFKIVKGFANGGSYSEHVSTNILKSDYKLLKNIGIEFARMGENVRANPDLHVKSKEYDMVYGELKGTKYYGKNPDIAVGNKFYEVESFVPPISKRKANNMFTRGLSQSNNVVLNNNKGFTERYLKKMVYNRVRMGQNINEIWLYEKGKIRLLYKKQ